MTANELRIGNYYIFDGEVFKLEKEYFSLLQLNLSLTEPIPLNEKWLMKSSFKFKELGFQDLSVRIGMSSKKIHFNIGNYCHLLKYVHELQDIYFVLTGKELEIDLGA